ncbi:MAG: hypothetical protein IKW39_02860 [Alphaproteobacteria bacterium]|nr:hypothetical protein [Alphaproteobacteria bacterium]
MKNFDETILSENGIEVLEYLSDDRHQTELMNEVEQLGDEELAEAYKELFAGDTSAIEEENNLKKIFYSNDHVKLVKESIVKNNFTWLVKLLKKREIDWFAEKMIAQIGDEKLIDCLISRNRIGWSAQNIIVEYNNKKWIERIIKKQSDLSPYVKTYVINNGDIEDICLLIKHSFLSFEEQEMIVDSKCYPAIKELISKYKWHLAEPTLVKIINLGNVELQQMIGMLPNIPDAKKASIIEATECVETTKAFLNSNKLCKLTQKAIIRLQNPELIRLMVKSQIHLIPINICIAETLNSSLIKEFIGCYDNLTRKEREYIYSSGNMEMINLVNALD